MSEVHDNHGKRRFELAADGGTAFSEYRLSPGTITFLHTEVPPALSGKGIGAKLARGVLAAARARGLKVVAKCPFIAAYMEKHREYDDLRA